jgi:hypothetical protein
MMRSVEFIYKYSDQSDGVINHSVYVSNIIIIKKQNKF